MQYHQAIITGASSGLGAAFARELAPRVSRLDLVARRAEKLRELAAELSAAYPDLRVEMHPCDLADAAARGELLETLSGAERSGGALLLINNAGLGDYGDFAGSDPERNRSIIDVNITALVALSRALLPGIMRRGGGIINIASLAAELPIPDFALYAASKAFVASFSEALRLELREAGIPVLAVCPGPVHTGFGQVARRSGCSDGRSAFHDAFYTPVPTVIRGSLRALELGRPRYYPSRRVQLAALLLRLTPLPLLRLILARRPRRISRSS